ncbi:MAG: glutaredoxin, partial [Gammaproteobacteria bacterium]
NNIMMIEIYGKTFCPYCDKAKALCEREGFNYSYKELDKDFTREEFFNIFPTARTFPQIKIDGNDIGGYTELEAWWQNKE